MMDNEPHIDVYTKDDQIYTVPLKNIRLNIVRDKDSKYFFTDGMTDNLRTWRAISKEEYVRIRAHLGDRRGLIEKSGTETIE